MPGWGSGGGAQYEHSWSCRAQLGASCGQLLLLLLGNCPIKLTGQWISDIEVLERWEGVCIWHLLRHHPGIYFIPISQMSVSITESWPQWGIDPWSVSVLAIACNTGIWHLPETGNACWDACWHKTCGHWIQEIKTNSERRNQHWKINPSAIGGTDLVHVPMGGGGGGGGICCTDNIHGMRDWLICDTCGFHWPIQTISLIDLANLITSLITHKYVSQHCHLR